MSESLDRRRHRTRGAIRKAFIKLATSRRYEDFSTAELIAEAGIGKSTFYEHFKGKDDVVRALMDGMLRDLAAAATGSVEPVHLSGLIAHFWDNRRLGRTIFGPHLGPTIRRRLSELMMAAMKARRGGVGDGDSSRAAFAAAGQIGLLHAWLTGEFSADVDEVAAALSGTA